MNSRTIGTFQLKQIHHEGTITERENVHKKAFTKWLNSHLSKTNPPIRVVNLISDLSNGSVWLNLFDVLLNTKTEKESGGSHLHNIANLQKALEICQKNEIKIEGINASDIAEGNSKTILGLLWNIIVHFQMKGTLKAGSKNYGIEKNLQSWCLTQLDKYKEFVQVKDFTTSWRDGKAFNAVLHSYKPDLFDFSHVMTMDNISRLEHAFTMASLEWNVPRLLEPIDVDIEKPDKKMITMYLTCLYERLESYDIGMRQSQREVSSTSSVSHQYVTTSSVTDDKMTRQSKAFYLRKSSNSSDKSDKSDISSQSDSSDFPRVLIEEKKSIRLSSISSDISSSSSSMEPLSPTSTSLEIEPHEEIVKTFTTTVAAPSFETDLSRRVKHSEMYTLSPISSDEDTSPLLSSHLKGDTDSDSTTSTDTVIHVETEAAGKTTTTTTTSTTTRRIQLQRAEQSEVDGAGETTTTTVISETYLFDMPGEATKKITYQSGTAQDQLNIEDKLSSECESILETTEGLEKSFKEDQIEILGDDLMEAAVALSDLEPRLKMRESDEDVMGLIEEREQLQFKVNQVLLTGRKMVLDRVLEVDKESILIEKLDTLERRLKLLVLWPIRDIRSSSNYNKLLDDKLKVVEAAVFHLEPKVKKSVITRDIKMLSKEREDLEFKSIVVVDLGRDLIRNKQIDQDKEMVFIKRMNQLETKIRLIMMWPIKELNKLAFSSTSSYSTYLKHKFDEAESAMTNIEPRIKKSYMNNDNTDLIEERSNLYLMVQGATGLGHSMIQHRLLDRKEKKDFLQRIETLEQRTNLLMEWPIRMNRTPLDKFLQNNLEEAEYAIGNIEPRIENAHVFCDNLDLREERDRLQLKIQAAVALGQGISDNKLLDQTKEASYLYRIDRLERRMIAMMDKPLDKNSGSEDHHKFLDEILAEVESAILNFEPRIRRKQLNAEEMKNLNVERDDLEAKVYGVVSLGYAMIEDKLIDKEKDKNYQQRMDSVDRKMKMFMGWPIRKLSGNEDYDKYFEDQLKKVETSVADIEPRIRKSANKVNKELLKEREDVDVKVYGTVSLGRAMMEDVLFSSKKEEEFQQRMEKLEQKMKMLMLYPMKGTESVPLSPSDHDKFFDEKLKEVESEVMNFEPRLRKKSLDAAEIKDLRSEREDLETKVYGVVSLGHAMIEDKLIDKKKEKNYQQRIDAVDRKMKMFMGWPIRKLSGNKDNDKYFEDKLKKVETSVSDIEPRIRKSTNKENKELLKEREDVDVKVYGTVSLGRAMMEDVLFSSKKEEEFQQRMGKLEQKTKMLMMYPIKGTKSVLLSPFDHDKFFEEKLKEVESEVINFEPRLRKKSLEAAEIQDLRSEREDLETKVYGVVSLGYAMIEDKLIDKKKEKSYQQRIDVVDRKMKMFMSWPIRKLSGNKDYDKYFEDKLKKVETSVADIEPRIRKSANKENKELLKEREDVDVQVYGTVSLGRALMEDVLFSSKKEEEFQQRMGKLEQKMKMLMMYPIKGTESVPLSPSDHDKFFDEKLKEVESEVMNFEPRLRKKNLDAAEIKDLRSEREDLETKVYGVVSLGHAMIEDELIDKKKEKNCQQRIDAVDRKMKMFMGWPIRKLSGNKDYDKYFEDKLKKVETSVADIEPRIRKSANKENKELLEEREDVDVQVYGTVSLGRAMMEDVLFSSKKEEEFKERMEELEDKVKIMWQVGGASRKPKSERCKEFDDNLRQIEMVVCEFEERAKVKDRESVDLRSAKECLDELKLLVLERHQIELDVFGLLNEGQKVIEKEDFDQLVKYYYQGRMDRLEEKVHVLREWLQKELQRLFNIYIILIKQHLERLHDWLIRAEARIDLEDDVAPTRDGVSKQHNDHLEFHKEVGAYSTINMILDIDMDDPVIDDRLREDIKNTSERWAAVWNWSEERKKRLADLIDDWENFREQESRLFDWLCDKEDGMRLIETTDISDAEEVESHENLLQSIIQEMESQEERLHFFQESGEVLIANAQYHNQMAKPIRDEINDFEECWKATLNRAQHRRLELKDSREKFLEMAELKKEIKEWLNEVEKLLSRANDERDETEEQNYLDKIRVKCQERDIKQRYMDQINTLNKQLHPAIEENSAHDINYVIKTLNRRWQDTSDKLDQCRDLERPLFHEDCWLVAYIKNSLTANKRAKEVHFK